MDNEDPLFEDKLRLALRRVEVPRGFAGAVLGRLAGLATEDRNPSVEQAFQADASSRDPGICGPGMSSPGVSGPGVSGSGAVLSAGQEQVRFPRFQMVRAAGWRHLGAVAAALLLVLLLPLIGYLHQRHQQQQAEAAARQFSLAMRLTHEALEDAGTQIATHNHSHTTE